MISGNFVYYCYSLCFYVVLFQQIAIVVWGAMSAVIATVPSGGVVFVVNGEVVRGILSTGVT